ncbi:MAG: glycosyltransferase family 4 protein [Candidatus Shapirobacteria bacterium]|jgi:glycosyltransferase involved in cell wall biosynthesis
MKLLFVLTFYRPHWTGLTQYAARVAEGLAKRDHEVTVLTSQHNRESPLTENITGVKVVRLKYWFRLLRSVVTPGFLFSLIKLVRENESVVAYLPLQQVVLTAMVAGIFKKKLYLIHNGDLVLPKDGGVIAKIAEAVYYLTTRWSIKRARAVLIQSEDYAKQSKLLLGCEDKWRVILPLFEIPSVSASEVANFKQKYGLENKILIGFSGRFVEEKGVDYLLEAIPIVIRRFPRAMMVLAGDYKINYEKFWQKIEGLIKRYKKHLKLLGLINDPRELFAFYKSLSLYVQPSRTDCFPSSQIEAMLAGTPSVCTNIPGARWVVQETGFGLIVKARDEKSLGRGIIEGLGRNFKSRSATVKKVFDYQRTLDKYEKLFNTN